jgi:AcrR family transcriptional regulator
MSLDGGDDELRGRVLDAAGALFYARGIQDVGMDDIRTAAGVSLKRLYQLFGSKDDLIAGYLELNDRRFHAGFAGHVDAVQGQREKLLAIFDWLASWFAEQDFRGCAFINCFGELGTNTRVSEAARSHKQAIRNRLAQLAADAGVSVEVAQHLALLAEGATTTAAISGSPLPARQAKQAATILIDAELGLAAPPRVAARGARRNAQ